MKHQVLDAFNREVDDEVTLVNLAMTDEHLPMNYHQAMESEDSEHWKRAMENEMASIRQHNVFTLVKPSPSSRLLETRWVFVKKYDSQGEI